jgi:hypothetical protein
MVEAKATAAAHFTRRVADALVSRWERDGIACASPNSTLPASPSPGKKVMLSEADLQTPGWDCLQLGESEEVWHTFQLFTDSESGELAVVARGGHLADKPDELVWRGNFKSGRPGALFRRSFTGNP